MLHFLDFFSFFITLQKMENAVPTAGNLQRSLQALTGTVVVQIAVLRLKVKLNFDFKHVSENMLGQNRVLRANQ